MNFLSLSPNRAPRVIATFLFAAFSLGVLAKDGTDAGANAAAVRIIELPAARKSGGAPLIDALARRKSCRSYARKDLDRQTLADLLWATAGENRADGKRTAPSAYGVKSIDLLVVLPQGAFEYKPSENRLVLVATGDFRRQTGMQPFVEEAPVNLLFVADLSRLAVESLQQKTLLLGVDAGTMSQNASLYCASKGLGTVVRAGLDGARLGKLLGLPASRRVLLAQTVGWPAE